MEIVAIVVVLAGLFVAAFDEPLAYLLQSVTAPKQEEIEDDNFFGELVAQRRQSSSSLCYRGP